MRRADPSSRGALQIVTCPSVCELGLNRSVASQKKKRKVILLVHNATVIT